MDHPPQVVFDGIPHSDAVEAAIVEHVERLEKMYDRITSCRVVVSTPHRHHQSGRLYSVRVDLHVPRKDIAVNRDHHERHAHEDVYVALRDAFKAVRRRLEDHVRKMRGDVKHHEQRPHGRVVRLFPDEGYGFIETPTGAQLYFHENAVLDDAFPALEVGAEVSFVESAGEEGPAAASVRPA